MSSTSQLRKLEHDIVAEVDSVCETDWYKLLVGFDDANIYQTWSYDAARCGRRNISHLVLRQHGEVIAVAQARMARLPVVGLGIAYVRWGPLWRRRKEEPREENFRQAIRALRNEYACRRGLVLRLYPSLFREPQSRIDSILAEEGFKAMSKQRVDRTLLLDLRKPLSDLRGGLRSHWSRYLKVAEKSKLEIVEGTDDRLFSAFINIYREMLSRKKFAEPNDIEEFRAIQRQLPENLKMGVMLCQVDGVPVAGLVWSGCGNSGIYLFGATSDAGLKSRGSYLLHWRLIEKLKEQGYSTYDLNGIDPLTNPGTYKFKADLCGDNGRDLYFMGRFETHMNRMSYACVSGGERLRSYLTAVKRRTKDSVSRPAETTGPLTAERV